VPLDVGDWMMHCHILEHAEAGMMTTLRVSGDGGSTAAAAAPFESVVPYEPLVAKLKASGGDMARLLHVRSPQELLRLESGKRYKFALDRGGIFTIAPLPADAPNNEYVHPILAAGGPVRTAGGITVEQAGGKLGKVTIDQDSKAYCPTLQSLDEARRALEAVGVAGGRIAEQDRPPQCAKR
jgi:hypothetical protein